MARKVNLWFFILISILSAAQLSAAPQSTRPASSFELRRAQLTPGDGLTEMNTPHFEKVYVYAEPIITARDIASASALESPYHRVDGTALFEIHVTFTKEAADRLGKFTEEHIGELLAIVVKEKLVSAPMITGRISDQAVISGVFSEKEARQIAKLLSGK